MKAKRLINNELVSKPVEQLIARGNSQNNQIRKISFDSPKYTLNEQDIPGFKPGNINKNLDESVCERINESINEDLDKQLGDSSSGFIFDKIPYLPYSQFLEEETSFSRQASKALEKMGVVKPKVRHDSAQILNRSKFHEEPNGKRQEVKHVNDTCNTSLNLNVSKSINISNRQHPELRQEKTKQRVTFLDYQELIKNRRTKNNSDLTFREEGITMLNNKSNDYAKNDHLEEQASEINPQKLWKHKSERYASEKYKLDNQDLSKDLRQLSIFNNQFAPGKLNSIVTLENPNGRSYIKRSKDAHLPRTQLPLQDIIGDSAALNTTYQPSHETGQHKPKAQQKLQSDAQSNINGGGYIPATILYQKSTYPDPTSRRCCAII